MSAVFFVLCDFVEPAASCMKIRRLMALGASALRAIGSNPVTGFSLEKFLNFGLKFKFLRLTTYILQTAFTFDHRKGASFYFVRSALLLFSVAQNLTLLKRRSRVTMPISFQFTHYKLGGTQLFFPVKRNPVAR